MVTAVRSWPGALISFTAVLPTEAAELRCAGGQWALGGWLPLWLGGKRRTPLTWAGRLWLSSCFVCPIHLFSRSDTWKGKVLTCTRGPATRYLAPDAEEEEGGGIGPDFSSPESPLLKPSTGGFNVMPFFIWPCLTEEKKAISVPLVLWYYADTNTLIFAKLQTNKLVSSFPVIQNSQHPFGWLSWGFGRWGKGVWVFMVVFSPSLLFFLSAPFYWNDSKASCCR